MARYAQARSLMGGFISLVLRAKIWTQKEELLQSYIQNFCWEMGEDLNPTLDNSKISRG